MARPKLTDEQKRQKEEQKRQIIENDLQTLKEIYINGTNEEKDALKEIIKNHKLVLEKENALNKILELEEQLKKEKEIFQKKYANV